MTWQNDSSCGYSAIVLTEADFWEIVESKGFGGKLQAL